MAGLIVRYSLEAARHRALGECLFLAGCSGSQSHPEVHLHRNTQPPTSPCACHIGTRRPRSRRYRLQVQAEQSGVRLFTEQQRGPAPAGFLMVRPAGRIYLEVEVLYTPGKGKC